MDADYLSEVLNGEGDDFINIDTTITDLVGRANVLKNGIAAVVENESLQFNPMMKESSLLTARAKELLKEMNTIEGVIDGEIKEELTSCMGELESLSRSLKEVNLFIQTLQELNEIHELLKEIKKKLGNKHYYECAKLVKKAQKRVKSNTEKLDKIEIFKVLSQEINLTYENLLHKISEIWTSNIRINIRFGTDEDMNMKHVTLSIRKNTLSEIVGALKAANHLNSNLNEKKFSNQLLNDILNPIILKKTNLDFKDEKDEVKMVLEIFNAIDKPIYSDVFENIKKVIDFLKVNLNVTVNENQEFLSVIGSHIAKNFADSLIKNYLSETIPSNSEDFDNYKNMVRNAEALEKSLQSVKFLPPESSSLMEYARNVNALFANKFCQSFLNKARVMAKKDLHNVTLSDEVESNLNHLTPSLRNILKMKMNIKEDIFVFNKSQISKHAEELVSLLQSLMDEAEKSLELCAMRLFYTARNIFEMYAAVVPLHHKKFLDTLPQQVALFHNNCLYFAHHLINTVIKVSQGRMAGVLKDHFLIFLEEAINLRSLAAEKLEIAVTNQRSQLVYILRDSGFATLNEDPKLKPDSEKIIRQCIRQLQILKTVWCEVLPANVYNRAMGFLIDAVIEEIISLILPVEDISSQTASDLVNYFTILLERGPPLFSDEKEIHRHVRKWQRFKEFVLVMKGSLRDIDDRWANGMGPLALEFTPEQIKHLIRALFQNSGRRAALLQKIR